MEGIEELRARLAQLEAERARQAADEHARLSQELQPEPGPGAVMYAELRHPDLAHELLLASGHAAGGHAGLGAAVSN